MHCGYIVATRTSLGSEKVLSRGGLGRAAVLRKGVTLVLRFWDDYAVGERVVVLLS